MAKYVYMFSEGNASMKDVLGGKGANLAEMTKIGLPVPQGFTMTTQLCNDYYELGRKYPKGVDSEMKRAPRRLETIAGKRLGDAKNPLLVSVRSGAPISMPGMMDSILNLGLNDKTVLGLATKTNEKFAYDSYRRFIQMFADVVLGVEHDKFEKILAQACKKQGVESDSELTAEGLKKVVGKYKTLIKKETRRKFPTDPQKQLKMARDAVFDSWNNKRAITYRKLNKIPESLGTAVNVQSMVFGNMGNDSATGVAFTRNPSTGEKKVFGEYLTNAQGEDVVAGIRTPKDIRHLAKEFPKQYKEFLRACVKLEEHYKDVQDLEFTIEQGRFYVLQTRTGKRTARAAVKVAVDMVDECLIGIEEALLRIDPEQLGQLLHRQISPDAKVEVIAEGLAASPGAASGQIIFDPDEAEKVGKERDVILVRSETSPDDINGIIAAKGILTSRGGMTSHAAVVARGMGKPCVAGCEKIEISMDQKVFETEGIVFKKGDRITIDGTTGRVIVGEVPTIEPKIGNEFGRLLKWADKIRRLGVRANADMPKDCRKALEFGADGVGLCRTEHMFLLPERLETMRKMIMAETEKQRRRTLQKILPMQKKDFIAIYKVMKGKPVVIRLLDPPLHEFLPSREELVDEIAELERKGKKKQVERKREVLQRVEELSESNPMLGHRGCRLAITHPEVYEIQVEAILKAAIETNSEAYIMIPLISMAEEMKLMHELVDRVAERVKSRKKKVRYKVGAMIEIPRAALTADEISEYAEFFSFGTNDLTQMTFGFSRDDAEGKFLFKYIDDKILPGNPFVSLDQSGVGRLVKHTVEIGRKSRPDIGIGICGEQGGESKSIDFCEKTGLDYVSCSPHRVPIARVAAAQAALRKKRHLTV